MPHARTNGISTYYEDAGSGPAVALVHGHSLDLGMWDDQVDALTAAGFRVVRHDVRGHGRTDAPRQGYTWHNYAADLAALLDHLGVERAHVVGCSMGGGVGLMFALEYPNRVLSLTLADSTLPGFGYSPDFWQWIAALREAYRREGQSAFERLWLSHAIFDGVRRHPQKFEALRRTVMSFPAADYRADYPGEPGYEQPDIASRLREITAPVLAIAGEHDLPDFQLIAEIIATEAPNARRVVFADAWHLPGMEHPEEFNGVLIDFLREVEG